MPKPTRRNTGVLILPGMEKYIPVVLTILGFLGGMFLKSFQIADLVATKPYVEDRIKFVKDYVDEVTTRTLQQSFDHSDMNRQNTLMKLEQYQAEMKGATVKIDMILDMIRESNRTASQTKR